MKKRRLIRVFAILSVLFLGMAVGALLLAYLVAGEIYDYTDSIDGVHLPQVDAIVCLAGGRGRIAAAGDFWYRYWEQSNQPLHRIGMGPDPVPNKPPILYFSGMGHQATWNVLGKQVRSGVLAVLKPEHVVLETKSTNTSENARWLANYAITHDWDRIVLITSRYHMKRARFIFESVLHSLKKPVKVETISVYQEPFEPDEWRSSVHGIRVTLLEYFKWLYYKLIWRA